MNIIPENKSVTWYPVQWCNMGFLQDDRCHECEREKGHQGPHDSRLAQQMRYELVVHCGYGAEGEILCG